MYFDNNDEQLREIQEELEKIREYKNKKSIDKLREIYESCKKYDFGSELYEQYDDLTFVNKKNIDKMYYNILLTNLPNTMIESVDNAIESLYDTIEKIHEHINVKPELYGKNITFDLINESIVDSTEKIKSSINNFMKSNYYDLSPQERENRYYEKHKQFAKQLIDENINIQEAIELSIKTNIIETLTRNIAFPFSIWTRINHLMESHEYGIVFDQDELSDLVSVFENKLFNISKIIASCFINNKK